MRWLKVLLLISSICGCTPTNNDKGTPTDDRDGSVQSVQIEGNGDTTPPPPAGPTESIIEAPPGADEHPRPPESAHTLVLTPANAQIGVSWQAGDRSAGFVVVRRHNASVTFTPTDGETYTISPQDDDQEIVYVGTDTSFVDTGLSLSVTYHYAVYAHSVTHHYASAVFDSGIPLSPPTIKVSAIEAGKASAQYSSTIKVSGSPPFSFSVSAGALPSGLSLDPGNGVLSGTLPATTGSHSFDVTVSNAAGSDTASFNLDVVKVLFVDHRATGSRTGESWANAYTSYDSALANVGAGEEIWVAKGTYTSVEYYQFFYVTRSHASYGGFDGSETDRSQRDWYTNETILSGDLDMNDPPESNEIIGANSYSVLFIDAPDVIIDGFTITRGRGFGNLGGGIHAFTTTLGLMVRNSKIIRNGKISDSQGGAAQFLAGATIYNSIIAENSATSGGGIYAEPQNGATVLIDRCIIYNNAAHEGGGVMSIGMVRISNSVVANNTALRGTGISMLGVNSIENSVIIGNSGGHNVLGGGIYSQTNIVSVVNSIIWGNTSAAGPSSLTYNQTGSFEITSSVVQGGIGGRSWISDGGGNLSVDPDFLNPASLAGADGRFFTADDGLRLRSGSPALDAGTDGVVAVDIRGVARPIGAGTDIGAYEGSTEP